MERKKTVEVGTNLIHFEFSFQKHASGCQFFRFFWLRWLVASLVDLSCFRWGRWCRYSSSCLFREPTFTDAVKIRGNLSSFASQKFVAWCFCWKFRKNCRSELTGRSVPSIANSCTPNGKVQEWEYERQWHRQRALLIGVSNGLPQFVTRVMSSFLKWKSDSCGGLYNLAFHRLEN